MQPGQELTHPVPTMALLQPSLKAAMCTAPCGWPHLPPSVSPFLLSKTCMLADLFWAVQHYQKTKHGLTYFMATVLLITTYSLWANNMIRDTWFSKGKYTRKWPEQCVVKVTVRIVNAPRLSINAQWWRAEETPTQQMVQIRCEQSLGDTVEMEGETFHIYVLQGQRSHPFSPTDFVYDIACSRLKPYQIH